MAVVTGGLRGDSKMSLGHPNMSAPHAADAAQHIPIPDT
jgi:hypothetical protein